MSGSNLHGVPVVERTSIEVDWINCCAETRIVAAGGELWLLFAVLLVAS